jgi:hypothetical protein
MNDVRHHPEAKLIGIAIDPVSLFQPADDPSLNSERNKCVVDFRS